MTLYISIASHHATCITDEGAAVAQYVIAQRAVVDQHAAAVQFAKAR